MNFIVHLFTIVRRRHLSRLLEQPIPQPNIKWRLGGHFAGITCEIRGRRLEFVVKVLCKQLSDRCVGESHAIHVMSSDILNV